MTSGIALCGMGLAYILSKFIDSASWFVDIATTGVVILTVARMVLRILLRSSQVLLDRTAPGQRNHVRRVVSRIPDVIGVEAIRTREAGKKTFVELTLAVDRNLTVESSCRIQQSAEAAIKRHVDNADVVLQLRPEAKAPEDIVERVRAIGARHGHNIHHITVHDIRSVLHVDMDLGSGWGDEARRRPRARRAVPRDEDQGGQSPDSAKSTLTSSGASSRPWRASVVTERDALIRIIEGTVKGKQGVLDCGRLVIEEGKIGGYRDHRELHHEAGGEGGG